MAIWQFDLYLVPRISLMREFAALPSRLSDEEFNRIDWWRGVTTATELRPLLSTILPSAESWSEVLDIWGSATGDRIDLAFEDDTIQSLFVRIDVRSLSRAFIDDVLRLSRSLNCVFWTPQMELIEPIESDFFKVLSSSDPVRFVTDPERFFEELVNQRNAQSGEVDKES